MSRPPTFEPTIAGLARITEVALAEHDLTIQKYRVLSYLAWMPMSPSDLADRLFVKPPVISRIVETLLDRGYLERRHDANDGRRAVLALTGPGASLLRAANATIKSRIERVGAELDATERRAAFRGLELWAVAMRRYIERVLDE